MVIVVIRNNIEVVFVLFKNGVKIYDIMVVWGFNYIIEIYFGFVLEVVLNINNLKIIWMFIFNMKY